MKNSPVTRFIWIRHAPVEKETGYVPDHDPNARYDAGAAERLGRAMPENARWIMSPLKRTRQTAEQVRQHLNHQAQHPEDEHIEPDIIEQDLGRWAGAQLADVWQELAPLPKHNFSFQRAETQPPTEKNLPTNACELRRILMLRKFGLQPKRIQERMSCLHMHIQFGLLLPIVLVSPLTQPSASRLIITAALSLIICRQSHR